MKAVEIDHLIAKVVRRVAELQNRMSLKGRPGMLLVTETELAAELRTFADELLASQVRSQENLCDMLDDAPADGLAKVGMAGWPEE